MAHGKRNGSETQLRPALGARLLALLRRGDSTGWLALTMLQGALTAAFVAVAEASAGWPWERQARLLVIVAILVTWCMALRAIREKLQELATLWARSTQGILMKASQSGLHQVPASLKDFQVRYIRQTIVRLRVIAAGISLPFLVLPAFMALVCVCVCIGCGRLDGDLACVAFLAASLAIVAGAYFRWSIVPAPVPAPAAVLYFRSRRRRAIRIPE